MALDQQALRVVRGHKVSPVHKVRQGRLARAGTPSSRARTVAPWCVQDDEPRRSSQWGYPRHLLRKPDGPMSPLALILIIVLILILIGVLR